MSRIAASNPARTMKLPRRLGSLLLASILALPALAQPAPGVYAIQGAKVSTLAGPPIEGGTVIIRNGKISAVGAHLEIPADAQAIDAKRLAVYPSVLDPVTQVVLTEIGQVVATVDVNELGDFNPELVAAT